MTTIAVTTTADGFRRWVEPLAAHGFEAVSLPCIQIRPTPRLQEAREESRRSDWLMITSPRAVELLWPEGGMPPVPVAAVGEASAAAARAAGGTVAVTGEDDGDRLVELLSGGVAGKRVVIPHGTRASARRLAVLEQRGAEIVPIAVYETISVAPGPEHVDGAVFASPSAVEGWGGARPFEPLGLVGAIGRVTAASLRRRGTEPVVADRPTPRQLAAAMSATLEKRP